MHRFQVQFALLLALAALAPAAGAAAPQPGASAAAPLFRWSVPPRFGLERDRLERIVETRPDQVRQGPWEVDLETTGAACDEGARFRWTLDGTPVQPQPLEPCRFALQVPREGNYVLELRGRAGKRPLREAQRLAVQDFLIVSLGDSVASGEAVPDVPDAGQAIWQSARCHRSARAAPARAARLIEADDDRTSVTFVHLACSGASLREGVLGPYEGVENTDHEPPLEAQIGVLNRIAAARPVDAVLLSIGANDVHFGDIVRFCATHADCFAQPFPDDESDASAGEVVAASLAELPRDYARLAQRLSPRIPANRVYLTEYFDPTRDENGETCDGILGGVSAAELAAAQTRLLAPLNEAVAAAVAAQPGWREVTGIAPAFRRHGYCAGDAAWVTTLTDSASSLGGTLRGRFLGTLHPNEAGQQATGNRIAATLEHDLYPGRELPARPDPKPAGDEEGGSSWLASLGSFLGDAWSKVREVFLIALGIALALVIILRPLWRPPKQDPFARVATTLRPLTLPLFVVVAVGSIRFGVLGVALVSAVTTLLAWRLVVRPAAIEAKAALEWERTVFVRWLWRHGLGLALALVFVLLVALPLVSNTPYFETVGNVTSALVLLAILLWFAAVGLRLLSYSDSWLRSAIALVAAATLVRLAMALGVLPGEPDRHDGLPVAVFVLAAALLALLVVEVSVAALPGDRGGLVGRLTWLRRGGLLGADAAARVGVVGLSVTVLAATALLAATAWGLVEAAERGAPLRPPEDAADEAGGALPRPLIQTRGELIRAYAPVLAFTKEERWTPIRVEPYLRHARIVSSTGTTPVGVGLADLEQSCPPGQKACLTLTIECESGEEDCAHGETRERDRERLYREGAVYVRVVDRDRQPALFVDRGPFRERLRTLVQYWYFYYYDEWQAPVFAGLLTQLHEGDWEVVSVGLDASRRPLFVADSAHCSGSWRYWDEVQVSKLFPPPYVHPLVAVAQGSHANYPDPDQKRTSDPASCAHAPAGIATALSYASNIRDRTEYGWAWYPAADGWLRASAERAPAGFPGTWGASDRIVLRNFNSHQIGSDGHGPLSPSLQGSWTKPVATIFCSYKPPKRPGQPPPEC